MNRWLTVPIFLIQLFLWPPLVRATAQQSQPKPSTPARQTTLTGCIDEEDGVYVLIHERTRDLIVTLEPDGFPVENFAKFLGIKVTIRGIRTPQDPHPVFRVRSIQKMSEGCGSEQ
jgi:hypothetical protein